MFECTVDVDLVVHYLTHLAVCNFQVCIIDTPFCKLIVKYTFLTDYRQIALGSVFVSTDTPFIDEVRFIATVCNLRSDYTFISQIEVENLHGFIFSSCNT